MKKSGSEERMIMFDSCRGSLRRRPVRFLLTLAVGAALAFGGFASTSSGRAAAPVGAQPSQAVVSGLVRDLGARSFGVSGQVEALTPQLQRSNSQTFTDPSGDSGNAPDVTTVTVSNDDAGTIRFDIALANRTGLGSEDLLLIMLDADQSSATGPAGLDHAIGVTPVGALMLAWDGANLSPAAAPSLSATASGGHVTVTVNRSDLGTTNGFPFLIAATGDAGTTTGETAGPWSYTLILGTTTTTAATTTTASTTTATSTTTTPAPPKPRVTLTVSRLTVPKATAGKQFVVTMIVSRNDTHQPLGSGTVTCAATVAGRRLGVVAKTGPRGGVSTCRWLVPRTAHAKLLKGRIADTFAGVSAGRTFSARVA
jgi:hypothetical protein